MQRKQRVLATSNVLEVLLLMILALSTPSLSVASTTTVIEQVSTLDYSQAPNGSYFPSFKVEERQGWPREVWPRGEAWSRRVLTERAMSEIQKGAVVVLFASTPCQLCSLVVNIFDEMAVPVAVVTFASDASSQGGGSTHPPPDPLRAAALELAGSKREPYVFLGTRFLGSIPNNAPRYAVPDTEKHDTATRRPYGSARDAVHRGTARVSFFLSPYALSVRPVLL